MDWRTPQKNKIVSMQDAVDSIQDNQIVYFGCGATVSDAFINAILERYEDFNNLTILTALPLRPFKLKPEIKGHINFWSFFVGPVDRSIMQMQLGTYSPVNFSTLDVFFERICQIDVAVIDSPPPDKDGNLCFGIVGGGMVRDILRSKPKIIAQINDQAPYCYGEYNKISINEAEMIFEYSSPPASLPNPEVSELDKKIASHIMDLIPDGACIQLGLGGTSNAVGFFLESKKDLGLHTEMLTDSNVRLIKKGIINASKKNKYPGKMVIGIGLGNQEMYDFVDKNEMIHTLPWAVLNKPFFLAENDNFISINNALSVDLTGQVASEGLGTNQYSTTGGQLDFVIGSLYSKGGKSFILLPSTAESKNGEKVSRISVAFPPSTPITTPRSHTQYIGTEYGCVNLWGQPPGKRIELMISVAHPDFREQLKFDAKKAGLLY